METAYFFPLVLWSVLALLLAFRRNLPIVARLLVVIMLALHVGFWWSEISGWWYKFPNWEEILWNALHSAFLALIWVWPLFLLQVVYMSHDRDAAVGISLLSIFTGLVWAGYLFMTLVKIFSS